MPCSKCGTTAQAIYLLIPRSSFGYLTYCVPCAMEHRRDSMIQLHYWLEKHLSDMEKMGRSKLGIETGLSHDLAASIANTFTGYLCGVRPSPDACGDCDSFIKETGLCKKALEFTKLLYPILKTHLVEHGKKN